MISPYNYEASTDLLIAFEDIRALDVDKVAQVALPMIKTEPGVKDE